MKTRNSVVLTAAILAGSALLARPLNGQAPATGSFNAVTAEVRDAAGQVILNGKFVMEADDADDDDDDLEWNARLEPASGNAGASGTAEVEVPRAAGAATQEIEFSVRGLEPGATYVFLIDGQQVGSATADRRGRIELERESGRDAPR